MMADIAFEVQRLNSQASQLMAAGRYGEAMETVQDARELAVAKLGDMHPLYAMTLAVLADCHSWLGRFQQAKPLAEKAVSILSKERGPDLAYASGALARVYRELGDFR